MMTMFLRWQIKLETKINFPFGDRSVLLFVADWTEHRRDYGKRWGKYVSTLRLKNAIYWLTLYTLEDTRFAHYLIHQKVHKANPITLLNHPAPPETEYIRNNCEVDKMGGTASAVTVQNWGVVNLGDMRRAYTSCNETRQIVHETLDCYHVCVYFLCSLIVSFADIDEAVRLLGSSRPSSAERITCWLPRVEYNCIKGMIPVKTSNILRTRNQAYVLKVRVSEGWDG